MKKYFRSQFFLALFILVFFPVLTLAAQESTASQNFVAGRDYLVLPSNASSASLNPKNKVNVIEFFSYGCPACFRLNPTLENWIKDKPAKVDFHRIPVVFESDWHLYARTYYVAKTLGINDKVSPEIFTGLQKDRLDLGTPERMADFFQTHFKVKKETFLNTYESPVIDQQLSANQKIANDLMIFQIPGVVVDGKYKVDPSLAGNNPQRLIEILNFLIKKEKKEKNL